MGCGGMCVDAEQSSGKWSPDGCGDEVAGTESSAASTLALVCFRLDDLSFTGTGEREAEIDDDLVSQRLEQLVAW